MKINLIKSVAMQSAFLLLGGSIFAQHKMPFTASGHIEGLADGELYLAYGSFSNMRADTAQVTNGYFTFSDSLSEPSYGMLFNHDYTVKVDMFLDKGKVIINGNIDSSYDIRVSGSPVVNEYAAYNQSQMDLRKPVQVIYEKMIAAYKAGDSVSMKKYQADFNAARDEQSKQAVAMQVNYIKTHPNSNASAWELLHYLNDKTLEVSKQMYNAFSPVVKSSAMGKETGERIATLSRVEVGNNAPGFAQADENNKSVTLSSYKGKYVLLEFWASWCGPCRAESPNVLKAYKKYKDKGFDVLSVSLDHEKDKWVEAVKKDGLLWKQVSDLNGWKNAVAVLYGINAVPANFLIDPSGKIVAQDLRGDELNNKLATIFK
ncbi:TlpA disulfide reductase family protein [Arachidicoccus ginsenosidimutans]|uniref:TlpA disulfide reductase family protein n=1 Tax=Arachidicoccus sp. BS20 TaxID=1850526 RepID=UPI0018D2F15C|nr:TlpA disulfide reductase family protein [Arachidicoccus sp. BS20]